MTSLLNLTLVVIGSCAEAGDQPNRKTKKAKTLKARTQRRADANGKSNGGVALPHRLIALSCARFISIERSYLLAPMMTGALFCGASRV